MGIQNEIPLKDYLEEVSPKKELSKGFQSILIQIGGDIPSPEAEYKFHPSRKWKFDFAWPDHQVAVELEGGVYGKNIYCYNCGVKQRARKKDGSLGKAISLGGGHTRFHRFMSDKEKYNTAAMMGWMILRFVREDILGDPFEMIETLRVTLARRRHRVPLIEEITEREKQVLYLSAAGFQDPEIASRLGISKNTVRGHSQSINNKMCVRTRAGAVTRALAWGFMDFEDIPWPDPVDLAKLANID